MSEGFWDQKRHNLECPCGATLKTDSEQVAAAWITAHKDHLRKGAP